MENRVIGFESGCVWKTLNIRWTDHVSEEELKGRIGKPFVIGVTKKATMEVVRTRSAHANSCRLPKQA